MRFLPLFLMLFALTACEEAAPPVPQETKKKPPELALQTTSFDTLPGWGADKISEITPAYRRSCARILRRKADSAFGALKQSGTYEAWQPICQQFMALQNTTDDGLRTFFETHFTPYQVQSKQGEDIKAEGLFTGYYESALKGSHVKEGPYQIPLHTRPDDLVMVQLGEFREDLKGRRIAGRVQNGKLKPYESRADIVEGDWPHNDKTLLWVDSAVDAFFVQIQGSGIVELPDGSTTRIGYAGQNGHPYYAIGRELIKRGHLTKENVSMQSIRAFLEQNPNQANEIMNTNRSYVFFREIKDKKGPLGGEGVELTAGRSLAIDRSLLSYGMPIWVDLESPIQGEIPIQRLMVTQDTGGAIRGPVRGDVFWGYGPHAETMAGQMKSKGRYWVLLPNLVH